jgi:hypothetical protein
LLVSLVCAVEYCVLCNQRNWLRTRVCWHPRHDWPRRYWHRLDIIPIIVIRSAMYGCIHAV